MVETVAQLVDREQVEEGREIDLAVYRVGL